MTPYGLRVIDYEYSNFNFQFFDLGNLFYECSIDYLYPNPPYFEYLSCNYPTETTRRLFASVYLSEYYQKPILMIEMEEMEEMEKMEHK